jgi:glucose uptake protein GlcU
MTIVISLSGASILIYAVYSRLFSFDLLKIILPSIAISIVLLPVFITLEKNSFDFVIKLIIVGFIFLILMSIYILYRFKSEVISKINRKFINKV